jgi:hypothetical protein
MVYCDVFFLILLLMMDVVVVVSVHLDVLCVIVYLRHQAYLGLGLFVARP